MLLAIKENVEGGEVEPLVDHFLDLFLGLRRELSTVDPLLAPLGVIVNLGAAIVGLFRRGFRTLRSGVVLQYREEDLLLDAGEENSVPAVAHSLEERGEKLGQVEVGKSFFPVGLVKLLKENIAKLQGDALAHDKVLGQDLLQLGGEPGHKTRLILIGLDEEECLMELETEDHEVLVDAVVVHLVPMEVEDVEEGLEPLPLVGHSCLLRVTRAYLGEQLGDLGADLVLVLRLIRVPEGYSHTSVKPSINPY